MALITEKGKELGCELAFGLGDNVLQIGHQWTKVLVRLRRALENMGLTLGQVVLVGGNHDLAMDEEEQEMSLLSLLDSDHVSSQGERPAIYTHSDGMQFALMPFRDNEAVYFKTLEKLLGQLTRARPAVLLSHIGIVGARIGQEQYDPAYGFHWPVDMWQRYPNVLAAFFGHYHPHQDISDLVGIPAFYVGSPQQHGFVDEGDDRGVMVLEWDVSQNVLTWEFHSLLLPRFYTLDLETDKHVEGFHVANEMGGVDPSGYYKVHVSGEALAYKTWLQQQQIGLWRRIIPKYRDARMRLVAGLAHERGLDASTPPHEHLRRYLVSKGYEGEYLEALLKIGLDILSRVRRS